MDSFIVSWDTMAFFTSEGRLIGYDGTNVFTYDVSILNIGEKLLSFEYGYQFFTSEGRSVILDMTDKELYSVEDVYMLSEDVIKYHMINWVLLAETVDHRFYQVGGMEFDMMVGKDLSIEQYQYGQAFVLAEPMEKMGYAFDGWVDMYGNLYTDTPTHAIILYAVWLPIE